MQDKNTTESTFFQLLGPILSQDLWRKISQKVESVDKYVKSTLECVKGRVFGQKVSQCTTSNGNGPANAFVRWNYIAR